MKILIISYKFPPLKSMASYRNYLVAKGLSDLNYEVSVLSTSNKKYFPIQNEDLENIEVFYLPTVDYRTFNKSTSVSGVSNTGNRMKQLARRIKNSYPFNLLFDLGGIIYIIAGVFKGNKLIRKKKCNLIIAHFPTLANLIIASWLKFLNPNVKWIIDFHHLPDGGLPKSKIFPKFQNRWIKNLLKKTDHLITVSEGLLEGLSFINKKNSVIELGFSEMDVKTEPKSKYFKITYCGSIYDEQKFKVLLVAIEELVSEKKIDPAKLKFVYAGTNFIKWNNQLKKIEGYKGFKITNLGVISREESQQIINESNINLLLSWNRPTLMTIIPGKYYDYLLAEKPIVLIINGVQDINWEERFNLLKPGIICYENNTPVKLKHFLFKEYVNWELGKKSCIKMDEFELKKHSIENQINKLNTIIQEIM